MKCCLLKCKTVFIWNLGFQLFENITVQRIRKTNYFIRSVAWFNLKAKLFCGYVDACMVLAVLVVWQIKTRVCKMWRQKSKWGWWCVSFHCCCNLLQGLFQNLSCGDKFLVFHFVSLELGERKRNVFISLLYIIPFFWERNVLK